MVSIAWVIGGGSSAMGADGATITAKVSFTGPAPTPKPINFGAEKQCAQTHGTTPPTFEDVVVNPNGTLKGVLVYMKEGAPPTSEGEKLPTVVCDQSGCVFKPHVLAVRTGQPIEFLNSDPVLHNVRGVSKQGQNFNIAQPIQGMKTQRTLQKPEVGMQLRCDVHYWMTAHLHVLAHPFFGVTGDDGMVTLKDLPAGTYTLEAWHEKLGVQTQTVTVQSGEAASLGFTYTGA